LTGYIRATIKALGITINKMPGREDGPSANKRPINPVSRGE